MPQMKISTTIKASQDQTKLARAMKWLLSEDSSNDEDQDVAMFIKSFKRIIKGGNKFRRNFGDKQKRRNKKRPCYECGEIGHFIAECPKKKNEGKKEWRKDKYKKEDKNKGYKKKKYHGRVHVGEEWDSEDESSSYEEEGVANIAIQMTSSAPILFTNLPTMRA